MASQKICVLRTLVVIRHPCVRIPVTRLVVGSAARLQEVSSICLGVHLLGFRAQPGEADLSVSVDKALRTCDARCRQDKTRQGADPKATDCVSIASCGRLRNALLA